MNAATFRSTRLSLTLGVAVSMVGLGFAAAPAHADDYYSSSQKKVSCSSDNGHRVECPANLRGYVVRDVDQSSRTECVVGRNWGYDSRGVWVDEGCRATFVFDRGRGGDHPRSYGYREPGESSNGGQEVRVKCESNDGRRNTCDVDLRGYRIADVREISKADCDIGRNFGYDDRGVWVDQGCRGEFVFTSEGGRLSDSRDSDRDRDRNR